MDKSKHDRPTTRTPDQIIEDGRRMALIPVDQRRPRHFCTKDDPWTPAKGNRAEHPDAIAGEDRDDGDGVYCTSYKCPHCGHFFYVELPQ